MMKGRKCILALFVAVMQAAHSLPFAVQNSNAFLAQFATMVKNKRLTCVSTTLNACQDAATQANACISSIVFPNVKLIKIAQPAVAPSATVQQPHYVRVGRKTVTIVM